jgi:transposase
MARIEVITGPARRRRWSEEQKRAIVSAAFAPGAVVSEVARRAALCAGQIYRWRQDLGRAAGNGFAAVIVSPVEHASPDRREGVIEVELAGARLRIPSSIPPALAAAVVGALR